jgi:hypothetical protein
LTAATATVTSRVEVAGLQHMGGSVERAVYVSEINGPLTPAIARQLAAALVAAAGEAEEMAGHDEIAVS